MCVYTIDICVKYVMYNIDLVLTPCPRFHIQVGSFTQIRISYLALSRFLFRMACVTGHIHIAIENTPVIGDLPIQNGDFP